MSGTAIRVLGLDPGATIGVAFLDVGERQASVVTLRTWSAEDEQQAVELLGEVIALAPALVAIERVETVHGSERMGSGYATGLCRGNWIGGLLAGLARSQRVRVVTVQAAEWRRAIVGSRSPSDAAVKQAIRLRVPTWPAVSNEHQRDAAGVALWAGLRRGRA